MSAKSLAVILLNWNDADRTMAQIGRLRTWQSISPLIIVVDNDSDKEDYRKLRECIINEVLIRNEVNLGFAGGNNIGINYALQERCDAVLLLNTDALVEEEVVVNLLNRLSNKVDIIGPIVRETKDDQEMLFAGGRDIALHHNTRVKITSEAVKSRDEEVLNVSYVSGMVILMRSRVLREIGLLDENYFFSGEVADLCHRVRENGGGVFVDMKTQADHTIEDSSKGLRSSLYVYYSFRNRFLYISKFYPREKYWLSIKWSIRIFRQWLPAVLSGQNEKAGALRWALMDGWSGRFGNQNFRFVDHG